MVRRRGQAAAGTRPSFMTQFGALCRKNWIILARQPAVNLFRCLILPVAFALFFAKAQDFFTSRSTYGPGHIEPLPTPPPTLLDHKLVFASERPNDTQVAASIVGEALKNAGVTHAVGSPMIVQLDSPEDVVTACPENFNVLSECFAAVVFDSIDVEGGILNYTLRGDYGLTMINVDNLANDDIVQRYLTLQWAIESEFITRTTGTRPQRPLLWEYTLVSKEQHLEKLRLSYLRGIRSLIVLALFLGFLGVVYHLPGAVASERANLLTAHLDAMGCRTSARIISWHVSISAAYVVAWIVLAAVWQQAIFKKTSPALMIIGYIICGLTLASWTFLVSAPFASSPTLAAIVCTFAAILIAIIAQILGSGVGTELVFTLIFPPSFFVFFNKAMASFEVERLSPSLVRISPHNDAPILGLLVIAVIDIFLFPALAVLVERKLYGVRSPDGRKKGLFGRRKAGESDPPLPSNLAVRLNHISKTYDSRRFGILGRKKSVVAIEDLSLGIPKLGVFCLLGRNGAAKSTTLSAIAQLINISSGTITYADHLSIGIASQKDVLWDDLTCHQHVRLWRTIKGAGPKSEHEDDLQLLSRCDLKPKVKFLAKHLSGGQKRKLQLACAIAGGSNLLLLDEISSGLDPLSRRAIWKLITANRSKATIVLTTHFLDEADYLGDTVAILRQPGKLLAVDNPVALKTRLGRGVTISIDDNSGTTELLRSLKDKVPSSFLQDVRGKHLLRTGTNDWNTTQQLLQCLDTERSARPDLRYQVGSATLEEVFLDLNTEDLSQSDTAERDPQAPSKAYTQSTTPMKLDEKDLEDLTTTLSAGGKDELPTRDLEAAPVPVAEYSANQGVALTPGVSGGWTLSTLRSAWTIFQKRLIVLRKSWLLPLVAIVVVLCGACIPLFFMKDRVQTCANVVNPYEFRPLTYPRSLFPWFYQAPLISAGDAAAALGNWTTRIGPTTLVPDNATFIDAVHDASARNLSLGGLSLTSLPNPDFNSVVAFEGSPFGLKGLSVLNLFSNSVYQQLRPAADAFRINLNFQYIPAPSFESTGLVFKWIGFFGLGVAFWPAFANVYPTSERASNVHANQYSNGANPVGLWLGHLLFELPGILLVSTIVIIVFAVASSQFSVLGLLWFCFVLYGISGTLFSFTFSLWLSSPLASWALMAVINVVYFLLYLAAYLLILTYDRSSGAAQHMTICHYTMALINPLPNLLRAVMVSVNLFSLRCDGLGNYTNKGYGDINQFGGPILYMIVQALLLFAVLVYVDSGAPRPRIRTRKHRSTAEDKVGPDVLKETHRIESGQAADALMVKGLTKRFRGNPVPSVSSVSFGVDVRDTFALLGPNGAGKTTTLACIRGVLPPTQGDIVVTGHSITHQRNKARASLGVCPQVNAIDANLTVGQHLWLYGRLKGVPSKSLKSDIDQLLLGAGLGSKIDELATSLSGGNQRKLSLAIALIGDRPVVLIDEFSSGVDPFSKREAWGTLASLTHDRVVVLTTHSMEEVDALASRIGIMASKMLAVGTPSELKSRFATYEVHVAAEHAERSLEYLRQHGFPGCEISVDTLTRVSVPGVREDQLTHLVGVLADASRDLGLTEMTLHEASTETAFLSIVREHDVEEEQGASKGGIMRWKRWRKA